jgi:hypothetical protein
MGPCARCVAAATLDDTGRGAPRGAPLALEPALLALTAGWVAQDVARWLRAETPATWSASWLLGRDPLPDRRRWQRHPYCGCAWWESA